MGALISLFISLIMMVVSLTMSLLMAMLNLLISLLTSGSRSRRRSGSSATGAIVLVVIVAVVVGALLERPGWLVVLAVVGLVLWLLLHKAGPRIPTAQELAQRFGQIHLMSGGQFEIFVADLLRAMGYKATVLGGSGDQGVDVIAATGAERIAIQCKNYKKAVGNKPVQEVFAGARHHRCQRRHRFIGARSSFVIRSHARAAQAEGTALLGHMARLSRMRRRCTCQLRSWVSMR